MNQAIAIYARKSVEWIDSISIESQIEFCKFEARGEDCKIYSDNGKNTVYYLAISQEFQIDHDHIQKIEDGLKWEWGKNEQGDLVITVKNNGEETAEFVNCRVKANTPPETMEDGAVYSGFGHSFSNEDLLPGETATFTIEAEKMKDVTDYTVDPYVYYALRKIELNGEVWTIDK